MQSKRPRSYQYDLNGWEYSPNYLNTVNRFFIKICHGERVLKYNNPYCKGVKN